MKIHYFTLEYQTEREANFVRRMKKLLSALLCAALLAGLLPGTVLAAGADWATDAVSKLNTIYGSSVFSADDGTMKEKDAADIVLAAKWSTSVTLDSSDTITLSRGKACEVLTDVFDLPVPSGTSAIQYLYDQNIINGKADGNLDTEGSVSKAEFAVLTYRVLNFVGGGKTEAGDTFKPGDDGYFEWMYLAARGPVCRSSRHR